MNCPRCGRPVGENANFCGGCGLPKADILQYLARQEEAMKATEPDFTYDTDLHSQLDDIQSQVAEDINSTSSLDYTTDASYNTTILQDEEKSLHEEDKKTEEPVYKFTPEAHNQTQVAYDASLNDDTQPLTTRDFLWMFILSGIPLIGLFYLIYTAIQGKNQNKRSFARAHLIFGLYAIVLSVVFVLGAMVAFM